MIELNKEYTYSQICEIVGWEITGGNVKKAQIKEIESCFEYYHPENKKTHKPKKSYIFTKQLRELVEPSRKNNGKQSQDIKDFYSYLCFILRDDDMEEWYSSTTWYCDVLDLLDVKVANDIYNDDEVIERHSKTIGVHNWVLYKDYISITKQVLKDLFFKTLNYGVKIHTISYSTGYKFIYALGEKSRGTFISDNINDKVKQYEAEICDEMNENYHLSSKMNGRQLLMLIYGNEAYAKELKDGVCGSLMDDGDAMCEFDACLTDQHEYYLSDCCSVDDVDRPLLDYHSVTMISDLDEYKDFNGIGGDLATDIIRKRVRKQILNAKDYRTGKQKYYGKSVLDDVIKIEKALFVHFDETYVDDMDLIFEQFDFLVSTPTGEHTTGDWGEPDQMLHDFSAEEILEMPTMGEVQRCLCHKHLTPKETDSDLQSEVEKPEMDSQKGSQKSSHPSKDDLELIDIESLFDEDTDDRPVLSQEEAWELFE